MIIRSQKGEPLTTIRSSRKLSAFTNRQAKDRLAGSAFFLISIVPFVILVTLIIALLLRAWPILELKSIGELLTGRDWHPSQGKFGFYPFIIGTFWVTIVALILAVPACLLSAIFLSEYCRPKTCAFIKPIMDLLAGIPSVVYGVWGVVAIVPVVQAIGPRMDAMFGYIPLFSDTNPTGFSILAGGLVLAVMIAPFIIAVTFEVLRAVPDGVRQASLAVGATKWQTIKYGVIPHTRAGIFAGIVLGASRALGETMAVLMVVGNVPTVPKSIFDPAYPLPALIANNYGEMLSIPLYDAALLGAALVLLLIVLFFNVLSTLVLRHIIGTPHI